MGPWGIAKASNLEKAAMLSKKGFSLFIVCFAWLEVSEVDENLNTYDAQFCARARCAPSPNAKAIWRFGRENGGYYEPPPMLGSSDLSKKFWQSLWRFPNLRRPTRDDRFWSSAHERDREIDDRRFRQI